MLDLILEFWIGCRSWFFDIWVGVYGCMSFYDLWVIGVDRSSNSVFQSSQFHSIFFNDLL